MSTRINNPFGRAYRPPMTQAEAEAGVATLPRTIAPDILAAAIAALAAGGLTAPVSLADLATQAEATIVGRAAGAGTGVPGALTAEQGRTIIGEVQTVTVGSELGPVTTLTLTPSAPLTDGIYDLDVCIVSGGSATIYSLYINADTTSGNYQYNYVASNASGNAFTAAGSGTTFHTAADTYPSSGKYRIYIKNGRTTWVGSLAGISSNTLARHYIVSGYHASATEITSLQITASVASDILTGSFITLRRVG